MNAASAVNLQLERGLTARGAVLQTLEMAALGGVRLTDDEIGLIAGVARETVNRMLAALAAHRRIVVLSQNEAGRTFGVLVPDFKRNAIVAIGRGRCRGQEGGEP